MLTTTTTAPTKPGKTWTILLWIAQVLIAALLLMAGLMKLITPIDKLSQQLPWTGQVAPALVKLLALVDLAGATGVLLPALTRIKPKLVIFAAIGIIALMLSASIFHIVRGEASLIGFNILLAAMAVFVAWGRAVKAPLLPK